MWEIKFLFVENVREPEENMWILTLESQLGINSKEYYAKL